MAKARATSHRSHLSGCLLTAALMGGSLVSALVLAELLVRLVAPQQLILIRPGIWQPADSVGYLFHSNLDIEINTGERTVGLSTDGAGFRVGSRDRAVGDRNLLLIGDSFMAALQVPYEQSLAGLMEEEAPGLVGEPVAVWNAAVSGWGPSEYLYRVTSLVAAQPFDLVVVGVFVGNDAIDRLFPPRDPIVPRVVYRVRWPRSFTVNGLVEAWLRPVNDKLETTSHLFILLRKRFKTLLMRVGLAPEYFPLEYLREQATSPRWAVTAAIAAQIDSVAAAHGAATLFVLIPAEFQVDQVAYAQYLRAFDIDSTTVDLDQPSRLLAEEFGKRGLEVVDVLGPFREAHADGAGLFGLIDRHLTPAGHRLLWRQVAPPATTLLTVPGESEVRSTSDRHSPPG